MRIILVGFGNVGRAFLQMIAEQATSINERFRSGLQVVAVLDMKGGAADQNGLNIAELLEADLREGSVATTPETGQFGLSPLSVFREVEADAVLELTPTAPIDGEPGISHITEAIRSGKHVVTTNKGPPALAMRNLQDLASANKVEFRFSGTVGGGTPILEFVKQVGITDKMFSMKAILNGTTNYILSRMYDAEISIEEALKEAQQLGYAESDPSLDIDGIDPALKLTIIANYSFNQELNLKDVRVKGIGDITLKEVQRFKKDGKKVKLVCSINDEASVSPEPLDTSQPICVDGSLNSIQLTTKYIGNVIMIGPGAGGYQTATAILGDLLTLDRIHLRNR